MHRARGDMADEQVRQAHFPAGLAPKHQTKVCPEERNSRKLAVPEAVPLGLFAREIAVRVGVQVEAREREDNVVDFVLHANHRLRECVEGHDAFVVGRPEVVEELGGDGEEGDVLDVGVVFGVVRHDWALVFARGCMMSQAHDGEYCGSVVSGSP